MIKEYYIYNVNLGSPTGHEQGGERPAIVIKVLNELNMSIIIPLTSNLEKLNLPYTVRINKSNITNLKEDSVALIFQIKAIDNRRILSSEIGKLEEKQINKIKTIIKDMLYIG